jgi:Transposase DDE domain group 1
MYRERSLPVDDWLASEVRLRGIRESAAFIAVLEVPQWRAKAADLFDHEQPTLFDTNGYRYSCFVTNTPATGRHGPGVQYADARHRVHARVEDDVRTTQDTGLARLPSKSWAANKGWCAAITIAVDLIAWLRLYALTGALAKAEPKTLRYRLFQTPARLVRARRYRWLRLPSTWPWATQLATAIDTIRGMPMPAT